MSKTHTEDGQSEGEDVQTYTALDVGCPICNGELDPAGEQVPQSFDYHEVAVRCEDCGLRFTVEYRAIDISWQNPVQERHSAVSQGLMEPGEHEYTNANQYAPLPPIDALRSIDWPAECECGEHFTPNEVLAGPDAVETIEEEGDPSDGETPVLLECVACGEETIVYAGED
ncbi:hypothetical protein [Halorhabdus rudnickae]|uniref:hypothetical protein n=1 Tax=Halorhabdus rudnickae TaxID=1775544 RepID=UPI0010834028|nr:hypothetical protein [Halorhabdus rudnickae]